MERRSTTGLLMLTMMAGTAGVAGTAGAQDRRGPETSAVALIEAFSNARDHFDAKALDALLTPDYVEVSPRGEIDRRSAVLGFYAADKAVPVPAMTRDVQDVRVHGDTAIVIGSVTLAVPSPSGGTVQRTMRVSYVERLIGGRWLMASTQYTGVLPAKPTL